MRLEASRIHHDQFGFLILPDQFQKDAGHATFCIGIVQFNPVAHLRHVSGAVLDASAVLGANGFRTFRNALLPNLGTAFLAGGFQAVVLTFLTRCSSPPSPQTRGRVKEPAHLDAG